MYLIICYAAGYPDKPRHICTTLYVILLTALCTIELYYPMCLPIKVKTVKVAFLLRVQ